MKSKISRREFMGTSAQAGILVGITGGRVWGTSSYAQGLRDARINSSKLVVMENSSSRLEIGIDGYPRSFSDKSRSKDYLVKDPLIPLMRLSTTSASSTITSCSFKDGRFRADFGTTGVTAVFDVKVYQDYFHWKLIELKNDESVTSIQVFRIFVEIRENRGSILNIAWNNQFTFCALGISRGVQAELRSNLNTGLALTLYRETGMVGSEWAIIACSRRKVEKVIGQIADAHGLPNPKINGLRAKDAPFNQRSYFFTLMNEDNHETILKMCLAAGIRLILPNFWPQFAGHIGHYTFRQGSYPGGEAAYRAIVRKFREAGIGVGMHVYLPLIDHFDSYASPRLNKDLVRANAFVLAEDLDEKSTTVVTERPPVGMMQGGSLLIEDERVDFSWISWNMPFGFCGAKRGSYQTRPSAHKAGTIIYLLGTYAGRIQMNTHGNLMTEVCRNVSKFANKFGLDMIYFDANEGPVKIAQSRVSTLWYDRIAWLETIWSMLDREDIIIESSDVQHHDWHLNTRGTCGDPDPTQPQAEDPYYKRRQPQLVGYADQIANLLPPTLGWSLLHGQGPGLRGLWDGVSPTKVRDIEIHLDVARQLDCPVSFEITDQDWYSNRDMEKIFKLLKEFEIKRLKRFGL